MTGFVPRDPAFRNVHATLLAQNSWYPYTTAQQRCRTHYLYSPILLVCALSYTEFIERCLLGYTDTRGAASSSMFGLELPIPILAAHVFPLQHENGKKSNQAVSCQQGVTWLRLSSRL